MNRNERRARMRIPASIIRFCLFAIQQFEHRSKDSFEVATRDSAARHASSCDGTGGRSCINADSPELPVMYLQSGPTGSEPFGRNQVHSKVLVLLDHNMCRARPRGRITIYRPRPRPSALSSPLAELQASSRKLGLLSYAGVYRIGEQN